MFLKFGGFQICAYFFFFSFSGFKFLAILWFYIKLNMHNISVTHAATWQLKMTADFPSLNKVTIMVKKSKGSFTFTSFFCKNLCDFVLQWHHPYLLWPPWWHNSNINYPIWAPSPKVAKVITAQICRHFRSKLCQWNNNVINNVVVFKLI